MCVRFAPIFWDFNVWKCYIPKWLIIYCSPIIHKLREPTQNGVIQFMVTKRGQISKWIWVSKPQPTIGIWLCMSFRWKSQLHTLHRDLSFDAILRAFFVVRKGLKTLKSEHFDTESSQVWQWKIDPHNPTVSKMVWTCPNRSQTSKLIIGNTFWNSVSDIRITFKKSPQTPPLKKEIP